MSLLGRRGVTWTLPSGNGSGTQGSGGDVRMFSGLALRGLASFQLDCRQGPLHFLCRLHEQRTPGSD